MRGGVGDNMSCGEEDRGKKRKTWLCGKEKDKIVKDTERSKRRKYGKWDVELEERIDSKRERLGIGTWNVRSLNETGRLKGRFEEVKSEMKRCELNVLGVSEVRWKGQDDYVSEDGGVRMIYSGGEESQRGVGIILDEETAKRVVEVEKCSDRLIMVKIRATPVDMVIIQVYMPTTAHEDDEVEEMYEQIERIISKQKRNTNVIVMGDFNAIEIGRAHV